MFITASFLLFSLASPTTTGRTPEVGPNEIIGFFEDHCTACHSPESGKKRAQRAWANARDLAASIEEGVIEAGSSEDSAVWYMIDEGDMPPEDSEVTPVSPQQLQLLAEWIDAGAKLTTGADEAGQDTESESAASPPRQERPAILRWAGHFHPLLVHFPIALLSLAPLAELMALLFGVSRLKDTASFMLVVGALSAIPAASLGWLLSLETSASDGLELHRWLGVSTAVLALLLSATLGRHPKWRLPGMLIVALLVGLTGHIGGGLSWGESWLAFPSH